MVNEQQAGGWRLRWLALMYTVQGLPYGLQVGLLPAGLRASGYSLSAVSLSRLLFLPWLCKPFIAPIVERSRRTWLLGSLMSLTAMFIVAAILPGHVGVDLHRQREQAGVPTSLMHLMPLLLMLNTFAAAHDVVVDGCAVTMLEGNAELGQGNAVQVVFYKLGSLFSGGVLLWALPALTWPGAMLCLAFSCAVASAISFRYPSNGSRVFRGTSKLGGPPVGVHDVMMGADMRWMAAFVLFYKLGEQGSQSTFPLLLLDRGFNTKELGLYIGSPATILSLISSSLAAPLLASYRIVSMVRWVLHLRLAPLIGQNLLLTFAPLRFDTLHKAIAVTTILVEHLAGGLLTTLTFTLMMRCVQGMSKHLQATCFSTLSALELLGKLVFASISGIVLDGIGTGLGFLLFLLLAGLPLLLLRHIH